MISTKAPETRVCNVYGDDVDCEVNKDLPCTY